MTGAAGGRRGPGRAGDRRPPFGAPTSSTLHRPVFDGRRDGYARRTADAAPNLREVRLLVRQNGQLRRICKVTFTKSDASIYLIPYAPAGKYFFGTNQLEEQQAQATFSFKSQLSSEGAKLPHLSLHESGRVHAYVGEEQAGPLMIPPLESWRGEHIATVTVDRFDTLGPYEKVAKQTGPEQDLVFGIEEPLESGRLALYLNGDGERFVAECSMWFTLRRPTLERPIHLGIRPWPQSPMGESIERGGVTAVAGWDPAAGVTGGPLPFIYVRGE